jgi:hypothetical protein
MKHHATTDFEPARVHAFAVAAAHRCIRRRACNAQVELATALHASQLALEPVATSETRRIMGTRAARHLNYDRGPSALST